MRFKKKFAFVIGVSLALPVMANVENDLENYFNKLGFATNTTNPGAYRGQMTGAYTGGSLYARNQVRDTRLIQMSLPSFSAGCSGIDLHMGSMSFINKDRMVELGKQIMANGSSYVFDLAMATTVPEMKQVKDILQQAQQFANNTSINSCQAAQSLVGGLWPKTQASQDKICTDLGTMGSQGFFTDYVSARMECAGSKRNKAMDEAAKDPEVEKRIVYNKNVVWSLLKARSFLQDNNELCEMLMSLTGTIIIDKNGRVTQVPPIANSHSLAKALIGSMGANGAMKIWKCSDHDKCLHVDAGQLILPEHKTLRSMVASMIDKIKLALRDKNPSQADIDKIANFAALIHIPVVRFTEVMVSTEFGDAILDSSEISTLIAQDLLQQYLSELVQEVANVTTTSELTEAIVKSIEKRIRMARNEIAKLDPEIGNKLQQKLALIQNVQKIEQQVTSRIAEELG